MKNTYILCIDDDELVLRSLRAELIQELGDTFRLEFAPSGAEALELAGFLQQSGLEPEVVVCDYIMPVMRGDEVLEKFHDLFPLAKNILLTGQAGVEGLGSTINRAGLYRFVPKPWQRDDLALTLRQASETYYLESQIRKKNQELLSLNKNLETLVYQRTEDLQHKNMTLGHRIEELLNLNRLAHKLTTARDIDTLTQSFGTDLRRLVKADKCIIALVGTTEPVLSVIWPEEEKNWDSGSQPLFNFVVDNRQSVFLSADEKESFYSDFLPLLKNRGATTVLATPLQTYDTFIGLLFLERMAPGPGFTLLDTTLVETAGSLFTGALETLRLLDRERTARQEAEQANQTKSRFLASMSHEIRTPMGAILGFTQLLLGENDLKSDHRDHLGIIQSSGTHLMNIINDILDMSKIEAGKIIVQNQEFSLSRVLEALKGMFFLQFYRKGLNFEVKFLSDLPTMVLGDESKLNQILLNLLSNSLKFTTKGSTTLEVNWKKETSEAVFTVSDTGKGIPKQDQDHVFEAFYQSPGHRSPSEGLGLGLAISRRLTEAMKGTLSFTSTGEGTTFTLQIPLPEARTPGRGTAPEDLPILGLKPGQMVYRTLIMDPDDTSGELLANLVNRLGFPMLKVKSCDDVIAKSASWRPDILFAKCPDQPSEASNLFEKLKRAVPNALPLIIFTGQPAQSLAELIPFNLPFLSSPLSERAFFQTLGSLLGLEYLYSGAILTPLAMKNLSRRTKDQLLKAANEKNSQALNTVLAGLPKELGSFRESLGNLVREESWETLIKLLS